MSTLTYENAGVDIKGGDHWVETIKGILKGRKADPRVVGGIGGFSGLMRLSGDSDQLIAGCCDGVGTKVEIARAAGIYDGLGQDLVAMNVNDLVVGGAKPLFFLDYIACGALNEDVLSDVVKSVADACSYCGCALLGGETAEMPGVYSHDSFDLAGFAVGTARERDIIDGKEITEGDVILGLHSSGVHSNGFTLVRSALKDEIENDLDKEGPVPGETLGRTLMKATRLYVPQAVAATKTGKIHGMAHITGGGLEGNINRVMPGGLHCELTYDWERPAVFDLIQSKGVEEDEMRLVFNLGIGYVFILSPEDVNEVKEVLTGMGEKPVVIGKVAR